MSGVHFKRRRVMGKQPSCIDVRVVSLAGEHLWQNLLSSTAPGAHVYEVVLRDLPAEAGAVVQLCCAAAALDLDRPLGTQVQVSRAELTYVQRLVLAEERVAVTDAVLSGNPNVMECIFNRQVWHSMLELRWASVHPVYLELPCHLQVLIFGDEFDQSIAGLRMPAGLQVLKFGHSFDRDIASVGLPGCLRELDFGQRFNQCMAAVALPDGLGSLVFGRFFNQPLREVVVPSGLRVLRFGAAFNQSMHGVALPQGLECLVFGTYFSQSLVGVVPPAGLQSLTLGRGFMHSLVGVVWPVGLRKLRLPRQFFVANPSCTAATIMVPRGCGLFLY